MSQLKNYVAANGPELKLKTKTLTVEGISGEGDIQIGTFKAKSARYNGVYCMNAKLAGKPGAEVWSVIGPRGRTIADFAIHDNQLIPLRG